MSADATSAGSGLLRSYRRHRFVWVVVVSSVVVALAAGATVWVVHRTAGGATEIPLPPDPPTPKTVRLAPQGLKDIHALVREFVRTAVARKNLAESYRLIGPALRENLSLKQWVAGQMTVQPYPVDARTSIVFEKPDKSYARSVEIQVHVVTPDRPNQMKLEGTDTFFVDLIKMHGRWLVNNWVPRWTPPIPNSNG